MAKEYKYFAIPFDSTPAPGSTVWYATWSTEKPQLSSTQARPVVICATAGDAPSDGELLACAVKDPPQPPTFQLEPAQDSRPEVNATRVWLALNTDRGLDE